jgi:DNA-binding response OmpR family regulator
VGKITILDDNKASSALLKMILTRHRHQVVQTAVVHDSINAPSGHAPDLVLISQAFGRHSGWEIFNHLRKSASHIPTMVYVLDQLNATDAEWIVRAVETVIAQKKRIPPSTRMRPQTANCLLSDS